MNEHTLACASQADPPGVCDCGLLEEQLVMQASRPSPAELIRRGKAKGLINSVPSYGN